MDDLNNLRDEQIPEPTPEPTPEQNTTIDYASKYHDAQLEIEAIKKDRESLLAQIAGLKTELDETKKVNYSLALQLPVKEAPKSAIDILKEVF